jgi:predicted molibdopterin-dependent oxidoreductase YjgC
VFDSELFDPYERLVRIEVLGREVEVPERNRLLRCFQFLSLHSISMGDFCWNGDCANCQIWYVDAGEGAGAERTALACRTDVREGMSITRLDPHVHIEGVTDDAAPGTLTADAAGPQGPETFRER